MVKLKKRPEWLHNAIRKNLDGCWLFGIKIRSVTFADHRSGTSAISVVVGLGPLGVWGFYPITWQTERRPVERYVSLREQIEAVHGRGKTDEEIEEEEEAEQEAVRAKAKMVMDYIRSKDDNQPS